MKIPDTIFPVQDEVLAEVRRARADLDAECDHDLDRLFRRLQAKQRRAGIRYVDRSSAAPRLAHAKS